MSDKMEVEMEVDKDLYSRTIAALGEDVVRAIAASNVLISGLNGLGCEIAKNVLLGGVKSLTLHDTKNAALTDLSSHYFLTEQDVGKNRAAACMSKLQELNSSVIVKTLDATLEPSSLAGYSLVVFVETPLKKCIAYNAFCRAQTPPIKFIRVDVKGVVGQIFNDFGPGFTVLDVNGENPHAGVVAHITNSNPAIVTIPNDEQVEFGIGEWVQFKGVEGMTEINGLEVKVLDTRMYNFTVDIDTTAFGRYARKSMNTYGTVIEIKRPKTLDFRSLEESIRNPDFSRDPSGCGGVTDFDKFGRAEFLHLLTYALDEYEQVHGQMPPPHDVAAAQAVLDLVKKAKAELGMEVEIDEDLVRKIARTSTSVLAPLASVFGGIVGQEVAKAVSNKHHPAYQYINLDFTELLEDYAALPADEFKPLNSRYDGQISVIGRTLQARLGNLKYFMVGCGALGCELLKNFAMMGVASGADGRIFVTDDDVIEKSNLSRQFLFRNHNVGQSKSQAASRAILGMNPALKIDARQDRVSPATESVYDDAFWEGIDGVVNALDNVKARQYVDHRCVFFGKPLLESGTMGTKCNMQCVIPHVSINYDGRKDPDTKEAPECALHNFPHNINHCLSLGRSEFIGTFETQVSHAANYLEKQGAFIEEINSKIWAIDGTELSDAQSAAKEAVEVLTGVQETLTAPGLVRTFDDCVAWARQRFEDYFVNKIKQLVFMFPEDRKNESGAPFWSPPKRFPSPLTFDPEDPVHMGFIIAAANLKAQVYNIPGYREVRSAEAIRPLVARASVPAFEPRNDIKIQTDEKAPEEGGQQAGSSEWVEQVRERSTRLPALGGLAGVRISPLSFEKDDDTNFHMDFIRTFANLRARNYSIEEVDALQAKLIAGRIIPALATTTSMVTGFVCIELIKLIQRGPKAQFKDLQANLALPMLMQIDPEAAPRSVPRTVKKKPDPVNHPEYEEEEDIKTFPAEGFTVWDKVVIQEGDLTVQEFLDLWKTRHGLTCSAVSVVIGDAARAFYNQYMQGTKKNLPIKMSELYKQYDPTFSKKYFLPACSLQTADGEDVETPTVVYKFP
mmetsp:Transcript_42763/g.89422  ORF Transcript_42763/g.89422 Transcript_42763/m.89422 type:complete len:1071 (-) Transcript_42763:248-3460(-)